MMSGGADGYSPFFSAQSSVCGNGGLGSKGISNNRRKTVDGDDLRGLLMGLEGSGDEDEKEEEEEEEEEEREVEEGGGVKIFEDTKGVGGEKDMDLELEKVGTRSTKRLL